MATITSYFEQAQLSMAAYALNLTPGISGTAYTDKLEAAGMGKAQAAEFAKTYTVVDQYSDPVSGLSASIFVDNSGVKYFAIRGTENPFTRDGQIDWVGTNFADIGADGIAIKQGLALFNYLQKLRAVKGEAVDQYFYNPTLRTIETTKTVVDANGPLYFQTEPLTVTGHSLGGHLAMMMSRMAPGMVDAVYTYNAPGFDVFGTGLTSSGFFNLLQNVAIDPLTGAVDTSWNPAIMSHIDVEGDIVHGIGNTPGAQRIIFSESANEGPYDAHLKEPITDSLAVYSLLTKIDPTVSLDTVTGILKASASNDVKTLELALDSLRTLFVRNNEGHTASGSASITTVDNRNVFYTNLFDLQKKLRGSPWYNSDPAVKALSGFAVQSLTGYASDTTGLVQLAKEGSESLAYRYALYKLNPFAITGSNASSLYDVINTDGSLKLYDPQTRTGNITDAYLDDRAEFLAEKMGSALRNLEYQNDIAWNASGGDLTYFQDHESGFKLYSGLDESTDPLPINQANEIHFGSSRPDMLTGSNQFDRLYGMDGNDLLIGGKSDDRLEGGMGDDVYFYRAGDGHDTIFDTDRVGHIVYVDAQGQHHLLNGGARSPGDSGAYADASDRFRYTQNGANLTIALDGVDAITINNFDLARADLGLSLQERAQSQISVILPATSDADVLAADTEERKKVSGTFSSRCLIEYQPLH